MNRTIKFRAWDGDTMWEVREIVWAAGQILSVYLGLHYQEADEDLKLMQFTGLLDKNGKEIYEGDILVLPNDDCRPDEGDDPNIICHVQYSNGGFRTPEIAFSDVLDEKYCKDEAEIIGNIYENPELLKV